MDNQGSLQQSIRAVTGTAFDYNGDFSALFDQADIAASEDFNERLLTWINSKLAPSVFIDLPGAMNAYATSKGVTGWQNLTSI